MNIRDLLKEVTKKTNQLYGSIKNRSKRSP